MPKDVEELSAASVGSPVPFTPYYDRDGITIYNADCRKVLPFLDRFDLLLTDPPYGIGDRMQGGHGERPRSTRTFASGMRHPSNTPSTT